MPRPAQRFACQQCGHRLGKWHGRCPACDTFGSVVEEAPPPDTAGPGRGTFHPEDSAPRPVDALDGADAPRLRTGLVELDRALGGGVVPGSFVLLGGDPGIGKSTIVLSAAHRLAQSGHRCLYVTAEESLAQIKLRADRLGVSGQELLVVSETRLERIFEHVEILAPRLLIIDSIQTVYSSDLDSAPGSVGQVREAAAKLMYLAKGRQVATLVIGHVTKDGAIAGPRVLEHMVDTVLYFEGEREGAFRILRAHKNRFGSTNEIGVFEMRAEGLCDVTNPSAHLLAERPVAAAGSVVVPAIEGTRPLLVEIQGLVVDSPFGTPRRTALGVDPNRVALISAIVERHVGDSLAGQDTYVNVAGGVRLVDPAADLGVALALLSAARRRPVPADMVVVGELGLPGEVRSVSQITARLNEAAKLGFKRAVIPERAARAAAGEVDIEVHAVSRLAEACAVALD